MSYIHRYPDGHLMTVITPPTLEQQAKNVAAALVAEGFNATIADGRKAHVVVVRHVHRDQRSAVNKITQAVANPYYGDLRHVQTHFVITLQTGRAEILRQQHIERFGDGGQIVMLCDDGTLRTDETTDSQLTKPVLDAGYEL